MVLVMNRKAEFVHIRTAAEIIGVNPQTIRRWEERGLINPLRDDLGHRIYKRSELKIMYYRCYGRSI